MFPFKPTGNLWLDFLQIGVLPFLFWLVVFLVLLMPVAVVLAILLA